MVSSLELGTDPELQHESSAVELSHPLSLLTFLYCACVHPFLDPAVPLLQPPSAAITSLGRGGGIFSFSCVCLLAWYGFIKGGSLGVFNSEIII